MRRAVAVFQGGNLAEAERICKAILGAQPDHFDALHLFGVVEAQRGHFAEADHLLSRALKLNPKSAEVYSSHGNVLRARGHFEEALISYDRALAIQPDLAGVLNNRGGALSALMRHDEALASYDQALAIKHDFPEALNNRGGALKTLGRYQEALASYDQALALKPDSAEALYNRASVLAAMDRHHEALSAYDRALALRPTFAEAHNNRGSALTALKRHVEAVASFTRALAIKPSLSEALRNRGIALSLLGKYEDAVKDLERALDVNPNLPFAKGTLLHSKMHCCDWQTYESDLRQLITEVREGKRVAEPFAFLSISDSAQDQLHCSEIWVRDQCPPLAMAMWTGERYRHGRIRVAYVSSDFREHPLGHLMAGLFEQHDRERFETIAVSLGPDDSSAMRSRLKGAFERFIDVRQRSDREVAQLLREMEVDVAVDGNGFTTGARPGIFALRPAPIQVNYLGYPGTMGADYIDYLLADEIVIPREHQDYYTEKVVYLPDTYQVNDATRRIAERTPTRAEVGLPNRGFVFCSFNNNYKITPAAFGVWMQLLRKVSGSVLWLLEGNSAAPRNLRREAAEWDIAPDRLVFAPRVKPEDHLARHRLADLFLDTLPYNAHTTTSDALWAGLPVLTCMGTTFAGRVAASLLHAIGLPELITHSLGEYESLALQLARDSVKLREVRERLERNRKTWPLFQTDRFRRHIEAAYVEMWKRHQRGEPPASFAVPLLEESAE
ncbi:MAG: tetratricopeptide repeat protein [Betaproteobacteria bacterium]|nr:tetratricopeptide repeat protein [Betaproteobacteria bacterium]